MFKLISFEETGKFVLFSSIRPHIRKYLLKAGVQSVPYGLFGLIFWFGIMFSLGIFGLYVWPYVMKLDPIMQFIISFLSIIFALVGILAILGSLFYFYYDFKIFMRTKEMETVLPDFLRYVCENLKGGLSFEKALWEAIKPRFGVLAVETRLVAKRVMTGEDIDQALQEFVEKYDSPMLKRSFDLIIEAIRGGAGIADIIERVQHNIRATQDIKKEISVTNTQYVMFISIIICLIAPVMFSLGYTLLNVLKSISDIIGPSLSSGVAAASLFANLNIQPDSIINISRMSLVIIAVFSSMIISIIRNGNVKQGIFYIPFYLTVSLLAYQFFKFVLYNTLGTMIAI
ncbi:type II secretion system F family protein [Candidatus Woesearchaeota archaeon]|nr:type II secretion system F family protein [Candidatus Woesearchaeota archaeon]